MATIVIRKYSICGIQVVLMTKRNLISVEYGMGCYSSKTTIP